MNAREDIRPNAGDAGKGMQSSPGHAGRCPQIPTLSDRRPHRPHLALEGHRQGADLVLGRPARRQPGADRPDGPRAQGAHVRPAARHGLQGDRDRLPVGLADRFRFRPLVHRGRQCARRCLAAGAGAVPARTDHPHLRGAEGRHQPDRAFLQFDQRIAAPRRLREGRRRHQAHRHRRRQDDHRHGGQGRRRLSLRIFAGELYRHRARSGAGDLQRRHRDRQADGRQQADHQPAVDGRDVDAQHLCRPHRMDVPQPRQPREPVDLAASAQ